MSPLLILITGLPASGKTTLATRLARDIYLPLFAKDSLKEILFDTLGWSEPEQSKALGKASFALLDHTATTLLSAGQSHILEGNFDPRFYNQKISDWQKKYSFTLFQIHCFTDPVVLLERYKTRMLSMDRHPGHQDALTYSELEEKIHKGETGLLNCEGKFVKINTETFTKDEYKSLVDTKIKNLLG